MERSRRGEEYDYSISKIVRGGTWGRRKGMGGEYVCKYKIQVVEKSGGGEYPKNCNNIEGREKN